MTLEHSSNKTLSLMLTLAFRL